jgi:hypothetical protein
VVVVVVFDACCGPFETFKLTVELRSTCVPAGGFVLTIAPTGRLENTFF